MGNWSADFLSVATLTVAALAPTWYVWAEESRPANNKPPVDAAHAADKPAAVDEVAENPQPAFYVRAAVDRRSRSYREGDPISVFAVSERDAYLYVLHQDSKGKVHMIFPNRLQSVNRTTAKAVVKIPHDDELFRWRVGPPFGEEILKVIASEKPLPELQDPEQRKQRFNPINADKVNDVAARLDDQPPATWAETDIHVLTYARDAEADQRDARRFGVFFGVSKYRHNDLIERATEGKGKLNLTLAHQDAIKLGQLMENVGRLDGQRVYVNEQATRQQMEQSITKWLPSVSRPGDTVFIFFSGHGGKLLDDNGDEADGLDEAILPHDVVGLTILVQMLKEAKQRGESPDAQMIRWAKLAQAADDSSKKQDAALMRDTAITDDLLGRWLQKLDGREIVVILDSCKSGGFATVEKGDVPEDGGDRIVPFTFDFLDSEMSRLKSIGYSGQALFAAAHSDQNSMEIGNMKMGVMSAHVASSMLRPGKPLTLEESFAFCREHMVEFYTALNRVKKKAGKDPVTPHQPVLLNNCTRTIFLRP